MVARTRLGKLDFADIKASIKNYLSKQEEFTDYNFEGSGLSQLINILAYNAHYDALAANFLANEVFLDTATKRSSIVSRAKELGYTPRSRRAATTNLTVTFSGVANENSIESIIIPAGTRFYTTINSDSFTFTTKDSVSFTKTFESGQPIFRGVLPVYEGVLVQHTAKFNAANNLVEIPNADIDTSTLRVQVLTTVVDDITNESTTTTVEFVQPSNFLSVTATTRAYLLQEGFKGYEMYFGDGTMGMKPDDGSDIRMTYIVTSGATANGALNFSLQSAISGVLPSTTVTVSSSAPSSGGQFEETNETIKLNAKNVFATQNRCVVAADYAAMAKTNFSSVKEVIAWDGSDNVPPKFGRVVLCVEPSAGEALLQTEKNSIATFLEAKAVANTIVDFVDPEYVQLEIDSTVKYDLNTLNISTYDLELTVINAIMRHARSNIQKFDGVLRYSALCTLIDSADYSILGNETYFKLFKKLSTTVFTPNSFKYSYANGVRPSSILSSGFYDGTVQDQLYLKDDGKGSIHVYYSVAGVDKLHIANVGTVNYSTGDVTIDGLTISSLDGVEFKVHATPTKLDIESSKSIILNLSMGNIRINTIKG